MRLQPRRLQVNAMTTLEFCEKSMKLLACSEWAGCCSLIRFAPLNETLVGHRTLDAAVHPWRMAGYDSSIYSKVDVFSLVLLLKCSPLSGREFDLHCLFDPCSLHIFQEFYWYFHFKRVLDRVCMRTSALGWVQSHSFGSCPAP